MTVAPENPLRLSPTLALPIDAVTETFGIVGIKGSGKSTTAKVLVEELTKAGQQCVIIDPLGSWWGLKASADGNTVGLPFTILGGKRGDVPITPDAGAVIADLIVDSDSPLIIDLSLMRKGEQRRFMTVLMEQVYHRMDGGKAIHIVVDECDLYIPQRPIKGAEVLVGAMEDLVRRGRVYGIGVSLISQRPASIHKDVLSQVSVLVAHRLVGPQDRAALDSWVAAHGTPERRAEMMATLAGQSTGHAWFWSPSWLDIFQQVQVRRGETFDSSATPKAGTQRIEPKVLASIDIDALRERMAATVAKAEADDPKALKRRIVDLERQLAAAVKTHAPVRVETVEKIVTVERIPARLLTDLRKMSVQLQQILGADTQTVGTTTGTTSRRTAGRIGERPTPPTEPRPTPAGDIQLKAGARRLLDTVARHHPMRLSQSQVGTLAGFKVTGGTFQTYKSILKREGLIDIDGEGMWTSTDAGRIEAGVSASEPLTTDQVLDRWRSVLKKGARDMLDVLIAGHPKSIDRGDLAAELGMAESGGTFQTYLSTLRRNGLADIDGRAVTASDSLFLGGGA